MVNWQDMDSIIKARFKFVMVTGTTAYSLSIIWNNFLHGVIESHTLWYLFNLVFYN